MSEYIPPSEEDIEEALSEINKTKCPHGYTNKSDCPRCNPKPPDKRTWKQRVNKDDYNKNEPG